MRRRDLFLNSIVLGILMWTFPTPAQPQQTKEQPRQTSTLNQQWLDVVLSIEIRRDDGQSSPIGTGFLVKTPGDHVLIVTAKHVVENARKQKQKLGYRLNTSNSASIIVWDDDLVSGGLGNWFMSTTSDLACRFVFWLENVKFRTVSLGNFLRDETLSAGAPLLILGFPMGLRSLELPRPIARSGIVARSDPDGFIADAFVFPGNSGGPVVYSPAFKVGSGLNSPLLNEERLIGVVSSYIPYSEGAVSTQTGRVRILFEENSGLANVVPVARLVELLETEEVKQKDAALSK